MYLNMFVQKQTAAVEHWVWCVVVVLSLALSGCATPAQELQDTLARKAICCKWPAEFHYSPLLFREKQYVNVDEDSPVSELEERKRYFSAWSLPERNAREIHVKSYFNGQFIGQFLNPNVLLLDHAFKVIERMSVPMRFYSGDLFGDQNAHMYGFVRIPDSARYLVLYGRYPDEGASVATLHSGTTAFFAGGTFVYAPPSTSTQNLEFSPTGELKLWVDTTL